MMEQLQQERKTRSIGVSNYRIADLEETLKTAKARRTDDSDTRFVVLIRRLIMTLLINR